MSWYDGTDFKEYEQKEYKDIIKETNKLINERRKLIIILESNNKSSEIYKTTINKFIKKLEKEK